MQSSSQTLAGDETGGGGSKVAARALRPPLTGAGGGRGGDITTGRFPKSLALTHTHRGCVCDCGAPWVWSTIFPECTLSVLSCPVLSCPGWPVGGDSAFLRAQRVQKPKNRRSNFTTRSASKSCSWYTQYDKEVFLYLYILYMYNLYRNSALWKR